MTFNIDFTQMAPKATKESDQTDQQRPALRAQDAQGYLDQVKLKFKDQPFVYDQILDIMKESRSQSLNTPDVIARVSTIVRAHTDLIEAFNNSQHVTSSESALNQLKKLYKNTEFRLFEPAFKNCMKKLLQCKPQTIYFKTSCEVVCKFLQHISKLSDEFKNVQAANRRCTRSSLTSVSSTATTRRSRRKTSTSTVKRNRKRKASTSDEEDELLQGLTTRATETLMQDDSTTEEDSLILETTSRSRKSVASVQSIATITDHDRLISSCIDVAVHYMQVSSEECRLNAVFFISKFLGRVETLDEEICSALKSTLPQRIRDRKPMIRAHAVCASRTFQDNDMTQRAFMHHFYQDPDLIVRKALLQVMDTKIFGYDFLCDTTQDVHDIMKRTAFQRLGKVNPSELTQDQLHRVIHNGLNGRDKATSSAFKTYTLGSWLPALYDGLDLYKLLESFNVLNNHQDICRLLETIYERDLDVPENNGASTKLHRVVEAFRDRWLNPDNTCLNLNQIDEKVTTIWLTLLKFCKTNRVLIKTVKVRSIEPQADDVNDTIEKILDSQDCNDDVAELYERLTPDLVNLVDFIARFVHYADHEIKTEENVIPRLEFIYHHLMLFLSTYEICDDMERKTVQEVLCTILKENLLTGKISEFILLVVNCLRSLIYHSSPGLMINYMGEIIHNVRSHLEDLISSTQQITPLCHSTIVAPAQFQAPRSVKKVRISQAGTRRNVLAAESQHQNIELKIATIRVELEELKDKYDEAIKVKDFDQAKLQHNKISDLKQELAMLHDRRCSIASDFSQMTMEIENDQVGGNKFSSTMLNDSSMAESVISEQDEEEKKLVFKHHRNDLLKCLQMYLGCLQNVEITTVPTIMLSHLEHLTYECLQEHYQADNPVICLALACNGLTALVDENYAKTDTKHANLLISACLSVKSSLEMKTVSFKCLVDIACQHKEVDVEMDKLEKLLMLSLRDYTKYSTKNTKKNELEFISAIIEGTAKLYYFKRLSSSKILAHIINWWYLPDTNSRIKQFIGIFLPTLVVDSSIKHSTTASDNEASEANDTWLKDLLEDTFIQSIEYLHTHILVAGYHTMDMSNMVSLISFLCNLIPVTFHPSIGEKVAERIDTEKDKDLLKYLKISKNSLSSASPTNFNNQTVIENPKENCD